MSCAIAPPMVTWRVPGSRNPQPVRQRRLHQRVEADAGVAGRRWRVGVDGVDPLQRRHVDGQATAVLAGLVVRTAQAMMTPRGGQSGFSALSSATRATAPAMTSGTAWTVRAR